MIRCIESRRYSPEGFKRRRYEDGERRFTTYEIPQELYDLLKKRKLLDALVQRAELDKRNEEIAAEFAGGKIAKAIAIDRNLNVATVNDILRKKRGNRKPSYTKQQKLNALLMLKTKSVMQVKEALGISKSTLEAWRRESRVKHDTKKLAHPAV